MQPGGKQRRRIRVHQSSRRFVPALFLILETGLYLAFLVWDLRVGGAGSNGIKYLGILLCLVFALWAGAQPGGEHLTGLALAVTAVSDVFLLLLDRNYLFGVGLFCLVQLCYGIRIFHANGGKSWWGMRLGLSGVALVSLRVLGLLNHLNGLALVYFSNFLCNVLSSLGCRGVRARQLSFGLSLFLCCDLCVGIFQNPALVPSALAEFARIGMWLFYLPGQVLIALSALPEPTGGVFP